VYRRIHIIVLLIALGATPGFAQSGGGSAGGAGGGSSGAGAGSAGTGTGGTSGGGASDAGSSTGSASAPVATNPALSGIPRAGVTSAPTTPASGGAAPGTVANPDGTSPAAAITQRQKAAGVAAPPATQHGEEATLDKLDQKLEETSGVAPGCPPTVTNCRRQ
jgi:hypothetical protein